MTDDDPFKPLSAKIIAPSKRYATGGRVMTDAQARNSARQSEKKKLIIKHPRKGKK